MTLKRILSAGALAMAALAIVPAIADSPPGEKAPSLPKQTVRLRILQPGPGTTWYFGSKQVIEWAASGLPSEDYIVVGYLKSLRDGKKGFILQDPAGNGRAQANYVVNLIGYGEDAYPLENGKYAFSLALYRKPAAEQSGLGELVLEKTGGTVRIKGSDAALRRNQGPIPDDQGNR